MSKTVVIGASPDPSRYSNLAVKSLVNHGIEVVAVGLRKGNIGPIPIHTDRPIPGQVEIVTLYVGPVHQEAWKEYIIQLNPTRVIFNPGTENPTFERELEKAGIHTERACTLVLLSTGQYQKGSAN